MTCSGRMALDALDPDGVYRSRRCAPWHRRSAGWRSATSACRPARSRPWCALEQARVLPRRSGLRCRQRGSGLRAAGSASAKEGLADHVAGGIQREVPGHALSRPCALSRVHRSASSLAYGARSRQRTLCVPQPPAHRGRRPRHALHCSRAGDRQWQACAIASLTLPLTRRRSAEFDGNCRRCRPAIGLQVRHVARARVRHRVPRPARLIADGTSRRRCESEADPRQRGAPRGNTAHRQTSAHGIHVRRWHGPPTGTADRSAPARPESGASWDTQVRQHARARELRRLRGRAGRARASRGDEGGIGRPADQRESRRTRWHPAARNAAGIAGEIWRQRGVARRKCRSTVSVSRRVCGQGRRSASGRLRWPRRRLTIAAWKARAARAAAVPGCPYATGVPAVDRRACSACGAQAACADWRAENTTCAPSLSSAGASDSPPGAPS